MDALLGGLDANAAFLVLLKAYAGPRDIMGQSMREQLLVTPTPLERNFRDPCHRSIISFCHVMEIFRSQHADLVTELDSIYRFL